MKLLTSTIKKQLSKYPLYSQDGKGDNANVVCKLFNPCGSQTWYVLEGRKVGDDYELYTLSEGEYGREYGYVMLSELENVRLPYGLKIERDIYFDMCTVSELN